MVGGKSEIRHLPPVEDDPQRRRPIIDLAKKVLHWDPTVPLRFIHLNKLLIDWLIEQNINNFPEYLIEIFYIWYLYWLIDRFVDWFVYKLIEIDLIDLLIVVNCNLFVFFTQSTLLSTEPSQPQFILKWIKN